MTRVAETSPLPTSSSYNITHQVNYLNSRYSDLNTNIYPTSQNHPNGASIVPGDDTTYVAGRVFRTSASFPTNAIPGTTLSTGTLTYNTGTDANGRLIPQGYWRDGRFVAVGILPSQQATAAVSSSENSVRTEQAIERLGLSSSGGTLDIGGGVTVKTYTRAGYNGIYFMRHDGRLEFRPNNNGRPAHVSGANPPRQIYDLQTNMWHAYVPDVTPQPQPQTRDLFLGVTTAK